MHTFKTTVGRRKNNSSDSFFIVGIPYLLQQPEERLVIVKYSSNRAGWTQRCVRGRCYLLNHDYFSKELRTEIEEWRHNDFKKHFVVDTLEAALECRKNFFSKENM